MADGQKFHHVLVLLSSSMWNELCWLGKCSIFPIQFLAPQASLCVTYMDLPAKNGREETNGFYFFCRTAVKSCSFALSCALCSYSSQDRKHNFFFLFTRVVFVDSMQFSGVCGHVHWLHPEPERRDAIQGLQKRFPNGHEAVAAHVPVPTRGGGAAHLWQQGEDKISNKASLVFFPLKFLLFFYCILLSQIDFLVLTETGLWSTREGSGLWWRLQQRQSDHQVSPLVKSLKLLTRSWVLKKTFSQLTEQI